VGGRAERETVLTSSTYCSSPSVRGGGGVGEGGKNRVGSAEWVRAGPLKRKARSTRWGPWIGRLIGGGGGKRRRFEKGLESGVEEEEGPGVLVVAAAAGAGSWMTWGEGLGGGATEVEGSGEIDGGCREWGAGCRATSVKKRSRAGGRRPTERLTPEKSRTKM
jgi:hypothetical protein